MGIEQETFVVDNGDGSISLDPYAGKSRAELKTRCGELCRTLDRWQHIALVLSDGGIGALPAEWRDELLRLRSAYSDEE